MQLSKRYSPGTRTFHYVFCPEMSHANSRCVFCHTALALSGRALCITPCSLPDKRAIVPCVCTASKFPKSLRRQTTQYSASGTLSSRKRSCRRTSSRTLSSLNPLYQEGFYYGLEHLENYFKIDQGGRSRVLFLKNIPIHLK